MNEFQCIERYFRLHQNRDGVIHGIGDDAAVLDLPAGYQLVVSTDTMVQDVHFTASISPADLASKLFAVNASDIAAMGAIAKWFTLNLALPDQNEAWIAAFAKEFHQQCSDYDVCWVGGDLSASDSIVVSATVLGWVETGAAITRTGACPGDLIYVSGSIGDAALALRLLNEKKTPPPDLAARLYRPSARLALGRVLQGVVSAMIDCSDGLLQDLQHICVSSGVSAKLNINNNILSNSFKQISSLDEWSLALTGGDDYELIMTVAANKQTQIAAISEQIDIPLSCIGKILPGGPAMQLLIKGVPVDLPDRIGYQHFSNH